MDTRLKFVKFESTWVEFEIHLRESHGMVNRKTWHTVSHKTIPISTFFNCFAFGRFAFFWIVSFYSFRLRLLGLVCLSEHSWWLRGFFGRCSHLASIFTRILTSFVPELFTSCRFPPDHHFDFEAICGFLLKESAFEWVSNFDSNFNRRKPKKRFQNQSSGEHARNEGCTRLAWPEDSLALSPAGL